MTNTSEILAVTPYIQSSGLNNNDPTVMRVNSIRRTTKKNIFNQAIPGTNNSPNNEIDFLGTNNRAWVIDGWIPTRSGLDFPEGWGRLGGTLLIDRPSEMDLSGLVLLEVTGSRVWFYDKFMTYKANVGNGVTYITSSGTWVEVADVSIERNSEMVDSGYEVGYILPYSLTLVETK